MHTKPAAAVVTGTRVATAQALAAGQWESPKQMYQATCGGCHGAGVGPPILGQALPAAYIQYVGRNGLRSMPPFRPTDYTDADLAALASCINAQPAATPAAAPVAPAATPAPAATDAPALTQPPAALAAVYANCSGCHDNGAPPLRGRALLEGHVHVVVRNGLRRMPAFPDARVSDTDLAALVAWLNAQPQSAR